MSEMEAVNLFNSELSSLYDVKPPISKGKMTSITKAALKAVKLYKHVVQSVEKFIQKCKPEYKIPGLYVIDSIIRQSRHQFGLDKDVFATRFARNIKATFVHLYKCPDEDKAKVIRVLNLWQKNRIFTPEVIQPLFDLADPTNPIWESLGSQLLENNSSNNGGHSNKTEQPVHFKKELLDFDYDEEEDDKPPEPPAMVSLAGFDALGSLLTNPEVLRQLQTLQEQMAAQQQLSNPEQERQRKLAELNKQEAAFDQRLAQTVARLPFAVDYEVSQERKSPQPLPSSVDQNSNSLGQRPNVLLPPPFFQQLADTQAQQHQQPHQHQQLIQQQQQHHQQNQIPYGLPINYPPPFHQPPPDMPPHQHNMYNSQMMSEPVNSGYPPYNQPQPPYEQINEDKEKDHRRDRRRRRSNDRSRRSTSKEDSKSRRRSRSRSGSKTRSRKRSRSRSRDRKEERERDKERARKGFPPMKPSHMSVCSTTLWVGHLSKLVMQEEISDTFGAYGDVVSIDVIAPRGCAFVVMNRRQDASRALDRLKNTKLQGKSITLAWAPGKGVKGREWKDYWELSAGVSFIPWAKLKPDTNLEEFEDGGCIDEDTVPSFCKNRSQNRTENEKDKGDDDISIIQQNSQPPEIKPVPPIPTIPGSMMSSVEKEMGINQMPPAPVPQPINAPFGLPPGMMGHMGMGMMVPPPMLGAAMQFPGMPMGMMGMIPPVPGLLGDMPPQQPLFPLHQVNNIEPPESLQEDPNKRRPDRRENREKKRSRFEDIDEMRTRELEEQLSPPNPQEMKEERPKDDRPIFERLSNIAEYPFGQGNNDIGNILGGPGPRGPPPNNFPQPLMPLGGNQFGPRGFINDHQNQRPWFDGQQQGMGPQAQQQQNPFMNPNPFAGNPFIQQGMTENPFELPNQNREPLNLQNDRPPPEFFRGGGIGGFRGRGWRGGPDNNWRGRGGPRGAPRGGFRDGREGREWEPIRDDERDDRRPFRGGRGGRRGEGRDWRGDGGRDRGRGRDRSRERSRGGGEDRDFRPGDKRRRSFEEDRRRSPGPDHRRLRGPMGEDTWDEPFGERKPLFGHMDGAKFGQENWENPHPKSLFDNNEDHPIPMSRIRDDENEEQFPRKMSNDSLKREEFDEAELKEDYFVGDVREKERFDDRNDIDEKREPLLEQSFENDPEPFVNEGQEEMVEDRNIVNENKRFDDEVEMDAFNNKNNEFDERNSEREEFVHNTKPHFEEEKIREESYEEKFVENEEFENKFVQNESFEDQYIEKGREKNFHEEKFVEMARTEEHYENFNEGNDEHERTKEVSYDNNLQDEDNLQEKSNNLEITSEDL